MDIATLERPGTAARTSTSHAPGGAARTSPGAARAAGASASAGRRSRWGIAVGVVAVLAAALWSLTAAPAPVSAAGPGELGMVGGVVRVEGVVSAARPKHAMPGMGTDDDPVAEDRRRVSVDVTLRADEDATLEYHAQRFRLTADGGPALAPHKLVLPDEELPPGTWLSGTLIFDVPQDATTAALSYDGSSTSLVLPEEAAATAPGAGVPPAEDLHDAGHG